MQRSSFKPPKDSHFTSQSVAPSRWIIIRCSTNDEECMVSILYCAPILTSQDQPASAQPENTYLRFRVQGRGAGGISKRGVDLGGEFGRGRVQLRLILGWCRGGKPIADRLRNCARRDRQWFRCWSLALGRSRAAVGIRAAGLARSVDAGVDVGLGGCAWGRRRGRDGRRGTRSGRRSERNAGRARRTRRTPTRGRTERCVVSWCERRCGFAGWELAGDGCWLRGGTS